MYNIILLVTCYLGGDEIRSWCFNCPYLRTYQNDSWMRWVTVLQSHDVEDGFNALLLFGWKSTGVNPTCFSSYMTSHCVLSDCDYRLPFEKTESCRYLLYHSIASTSQSCRHVTFYFPAWSFSASSTSLHTPSSLDPSQFLLHSSEPSPDTRCPF